MEEYQAEVVVDPPEEPSIEDVNKHLLKKLDDLILATDSKSNPEMVKVLTESVAKLNSSIKGSNIFAPKETEEERLEREQGEAFRSVISGENIQG